ncbi:MAG: hypothetical protein ABI724_04085 [Betaproteobacteria bacterium]
MSRILAVAALATAIFGLKRWLDQRYLKVPQRPRNPAESWENEGGAVAPHPTTLDTPAVAP